MEQRFNHSQLSFRPSALNQSFVRMALASNWLWVALAISMALSGFYHFGVRGAYLATALVFIGIVRIVCRQLGKSRLLLLPHGRLARTVFCMAVACITIAACLSLYKSPSVYWNYGTDSYTWRPAVALSRQAWGGEKAALQLHPLLDQSQSESPLGPATAAAELGHIYPGTPKRVMLRVTQPESVIADSHNNPNRNHDPAQGLSMRLEAKADGYWTTLQVLHLDLARDPEQRSWQKVPLDLAAQVTDLRVAVSAPSPLYDDKRGPVWIHVEEVTRKGVWTSIRPLFMLNDLVWITFLSWLCLAMVTELTERLSAAGYFTLVSASSARDGSLLLGVLLCCALLAPSICWMLIDKSPFGGDQSQYGTATLELFQAWRHSPGTWINKMTTTLGFKAPGIMWIGQFFVGLGHWMGSINQGLLLSIAVTSLAALLLVFGSLWTLSMGNLAVSLAGVLLIASSKLFMERSRDYMVEPLQLLSVAWFVYIMCRSPQWSRPLVLAQLTGAASLALLAKVSSPLYCVIPCLITLGPVFWWRPKNRGWKLKDLSFIGSAVAALILFLMTLTWYCKNMDRVMLHASYSSSGPLAAVWGKEDTFFNSLRYWMSAVWDFFFSLNTWILAAAVFLTGCIATSFHRKDPGQKYATVCAAAALTQIGLVLAVFSLSANRTVRYALPVLPYFALLMGWGLIQVRSRLVNFATVVLLSLQLLIGAKHSMQFADRLGKREQILQEIVGLTCGQSEETSPYTVIALDPVMKGDWLAPEPANYVAAREQLANSGACGKPHRYGYLGDYFFGNSADNSWKSLLSRSPGHIVTADPDIYPPSEHYLNQALKPRNFNIFLSHLRSDPFFSLLGSLKSDPGILVFRHVNYVNEGRKLSDRGEHAAAIKLLEKVSQVEPQNSEAWANLQLALLRSGEYERSIAAGQQGLRLVPSHYYLLTHLGLAHEHLGQIEKAIASSRQALKNAPNDECRKATEKKLADLQVALDRSDEPPSHGNFTPEAELRD